MPSAAELCCSELERQRVSEQNYFQVPGSWRGWERVVFKCCRGALAAEGIEDFLQNDVSVWVASRGKSPVFAVRRRECCAV